MRSADIKTLKIKILKVVVESYGYHFLCLLSPSCRWRQFIGCLWFNQQRAYQMNQAFLR